jgi:hypothetical protein
MPHAIARQFSHSMEDKKMFRTVKWFSKKGPLQRAMGAAVRWIAGVVIAALGFQAIYSLLLTELE